MIIILLCKCFDFIFQFGKKKQISHNSLVSRSDYGLIFSSYNRNNKYLHVTYLYKKLVHEKKELA